ARPDAKVEFQLACDLGKVEVELDLLAPVASGRLARQCQSRLATRNKYCDHSLVWLRRGCISHHAHAGTPILRVRLVCCSTERHSIGTCRFAGSTRQDFRQLHHGIICPYHWTSAVTLLKHDVAKLADHPQAFPDIVCVARI